MKDVVPFNHPCLQKPTIKMIDKFTATFGDGFHFMDIIRVSVHHYFKKRHFFSLIEAFLHGI